MTEKRRFIYLAVPYSGADEEGRALRFRLANQAAYHLVKEGNHVFSPISHTHPIATYDEDIPLGWDYWEEYDRIMLSICTHLAVLMLAGWKESTGVQAEIKIAKEMGLEIFYIDPMSGKERCSPDE